MPKHKMLKAISSEKAIYINTKKLNSGAEQSIS